MLKLSIIERMKDILLCLGVSVGFFHVAFIIGQLKKNNGIVDPLWGISFTVLALFSYLLGNKTTVATIATALVCAWGLRLGYHLMKRFLSSKSEDWRYQEFRKNWGKHPILGAYFQVYLTQSILAFIVMLPVIAINMLSGKNAYYSWPLLVLGLLIWLKGYAFEVIGDKQLKDFLAQPNNKGKLMTKGLWSLTRHPNYYGEVVLWWGMFVIVMAQSPRYAWTVVGTLTISYLVRFVSGVPLTEKKQSKHPDWPAYAKKTPAFFPNLLRKL